MGIYYKNEFGWELRFRFGNTIYILNLNGAIGDETSNQDLWRSGWRIGFTKISRFISPFGIYILKATYDI